MISKGHGVTLLLWMLVDSVCSVSVRYPRSIGTDGTSIVHYSYGTAGFRTLSHTLEAPMARVGLLAALLSAYCGGHAVGIMVTASHNHNSDNGVKIMDTLGEMIHAQWEAFASILANVPEEHVWNTMQKFAKDTLGIQDLEQIRDRLANAKVFIGYDTRSSSVKLKNIVIEGVEALGARAFDHGLVTTPQLHWIVRAFNAQASAIGEKIQFTSMEPPFNPKQNLDAYFRNLSEAFIDLMNAASGEEKHAPITVNVDCANGIGAVSLKELSGLVSEHLAINLFNDDIKNPSKLNKDAGAEHVQKNRAFPQGVDSAKDHGKRFASVDGDADRLVYYYVGDSSDFQLLDGDKIIALTGAVIQDLVSASKLNLNVGVVQTAYANGASTDYITNTLKLKVSCVPTGVKYLHHEAAHFDVGIYFEANGHGTILFKPSAIELIQKAANEGIPSARKLLMLVKLINQAVGDAISDLLLVEVCLKLMNWSLQDWNSLYTDLPSYQSKVPVKDRSLIKTTDAERRTTSPAGLQEALDALVSTVSKGRAFVRPSGTEDVVRVYAEAASEELVRKLGKDVEKLIHQYV